eukprot:9491779-Pyramimonas_sp.AAC.1
MLLRVCQGFGIRCYEDFGSSVIARKHPHARPHVYLIMRVHQHKRYTEHSISRVLKIALAKKLRQHLEDALEGNTVERIRAIMKPTEVTDTCSPKSP